MADEVKAAPTLDSLVDDLMGGDEGMGAGEEETTTTDETGTEEFETEGQLEDSEEGGTEDEVGEEEDEEEPAELDNEEEPEEEGAETEDEGDSEETFLSKESLAKHQKEIAKDPHLSAIYKSMQRDYTRKTMEVAQIRDEVQQIHSEYQEFEQTLQDTAEGGGREQFLLDVALAAPEVFQRAFDKAAQLLEDPEAQKRYEKEREVEQRERQLSEREKADLRRAQQARVGVIHETAESFAQKFGIKDDAGLKVAKKYVAQVILQNRQAQQHTDVFITEQQIRDAVKEAASDINARAGGRRKAGRAASPEEVKDIAKKSRPRQAPGKRSPSSATTLKPPTNLPRGVDALDARIDQVLSG